MATTRTLRPVPVLSLFLQTSKRTPTAQCLYQSGPSQTLRQRQQCRTFVSNPFQSSQSLTASRTLEYPSKVIYSVIADVGNYSTFLPYCQGSVVTKTSQPAQDGKSYPEEAKLLIGFNGDVSQTFWSRVYCVPHTVVEAVSGDSDTALAPADIAHHSARPPADQDPSRNNSVLSTLRTRWTLRHFHYKPPPESATHPETTHKNHDETSDVPGQDRTEVNLNIEFSFANPMYAALSSAAAPKVADKMIEAFEKRVKAVTDGSAGVKQA